MLRDELRDMYPRYAGSNVLDNVINHALFCKGRSKDLEADDVNNLILGLDTPEEIDYKIAGLNQTFLEGELVKSPEDLIQRLAASWRELKEL